MCFTLFAGTTKPLPRRASGKSDADFPLTYLPVRSLGESELPVRAHFTKPEVQCIGSTTGCGCDFPSAMLLNEWYHWEDPDIPEDASDRFNREALVDLLKSSGDTNLELFATWNADPTVKAREEISLQTIIDREFRFKEQGFYIVHNVE
jgi:hypothetical protein